MPRISGVPGKTILVVDEADVMREILSEMLEGMGHVVQAETSAEKALKTLVAGTENFGLVLADLAVDAAEEELIELTVRSEIPLVLMTVSWGPLTEEAAKARGICKLLYKPFTRAELCEALEGVLWPPPAPGERHFSQ